MDFVSIFTLFAVMVLLALIPSSSVVLVLSRAASAGTIHGLAVALGIALADVIFAMLAIMGMTALAGATGTLFSLVKIGCGLYLIVFGWQLFRSAHAERLARGDRPRDKAAASPRQQHRLYVSFLSGALITFADWKAIIFYASFFPLYLPVASLSATEIVTLLLVTAAAVGSVKSAYAVLGGGIATTVLSRSHSRLLRSIAGGTVIGAGGYMLFKP